MEDFLAALMRGLSLDQLGIALTGVTAIWLSQDPRETVRRWSSVLGLLGQPFWFWAAYKAAQWGIFGLCFLYTWSWARGFRTYWVTPWIARRHVRILEAVAYWRGNRVSPGPLLTRGWLKTPFKGGRNEWPSQVTERPASPAPMH